MTYTAVQVSVDERQSQKLRNAIEEKKPLSVKVIISRDLEKKTVLFTPAQIKKIERAQLIRKNSLSIQMSRRQVQANTVHKGGFLWGLLSRLAPAVLGGIASGLASKAISGGQGIFVQRKGQCAKVEPVKGGGLYLSPHPWLNARGEGVFVSDGSGIEKGSGLLFGENSPLKNVPFLNILF